MQVMLPQFALWRSPLHTLYCLDVPLKFSRVMPIFFRYPFQEEELQEERQEYRWMRRSLRCIRKGHAANRPVRRESCASPDKCATSNRSPPLVPTRRWMAHIQRRAILRAFPVCAPRTRPALASTSTAPPMVRPSTRSRLPSRDPPKKPTTSASRKVSIRVRVTTLCILYPGAGTEASADDDQEPAAICTSGMERPCKPAAPYAPPLTHQHKYHSFLFVLKFATVFFPA